MSKDSHHVVPDPKGGWNVRRSNSKKPSSHFDNKKDAVDSGREISRNQGTELVIHRRDGKIHQKDSHGRDQNPPRDKDTHKK